jgi:predicted ATPase with chaperone activity
MQDFNVVGLPPNAVKESRERIKSALRNCGFEFPHGQGVTINRAPANVRKEGSAFDLPMALGLVGCMGHFPLLGCVLRPFSRNSRSAVAFAFLQPSSSAPLT